MRRCRSRVSSTIEWSSIATPRMSCPSACGPKVSWSHVSRPRAIFRWKRISSSRSGPSTSSISKSASCWCARVRLRASSRKPVTSCGRVWMKSRRISSVRAAAHRWISGCDMAHLALSNVTKKFGRHTALAGLDLEIADAEFFVLLGPTGAGKTTTLRLIAGLEKPDQGSIRIGGEDVASWSPAQRDVALVFQYYSLYPHYTVRQNLEFPLKAKHRRLSTQEIGERVGKAAKTLRIDHLLDRKTDRLSGGEMQRVSIGRAIVRTPA